MLSVLTGPVFAASDDRLLALAKSEVSAYLETLKALVLTESGSDDAKGLASMANQLEGRLADLGFVTERRKIDAGVKADTVVGVKTGTGRQRVLLMAHMDTVHRKGVLQSEPFREEEKRVYGPGVADAKGGIAMILHAVHLLNRMGWDDYSTLTVHFNPDEEVGSPGSGDQIAALGAKSDIVLSFEPTWAGAPGDYIMIGTAAYAQFRMEVRGRTSHAGAASDTGRNAVVELSHQILQTRDLDKDVSGVQLNWTNVNADQAFNQIPGVAFAIGDVRITKPGAEIELQELLQTTVNNNPLVPDTETTISFEILNPGLQANDATETAAEVMKKVYRDLGVLQVSLVRTVNATTDAAYAGRESDAAVIEGMGPTGDHYHAKGEFIRIDSIAPRLYIVTQTLIELGRQH